jgi:CheY-like chemotaxis protein
MKMATNKRKILIVDDEAVIRGLVIRILGEDYRVVQAQNGESAITLTRNEKPDLVLMDMMMPIMDGLTACAAIKKDPATKSIPVVMLTAVDGEGNKRMAEEVWGANGYLTKPFESQTLLSTIANFLGNMNLGG